MSRRNLSIGSALIASLILFATNTADAREQKQCPEVNCAPGDHNLTADKFAQVFGRAHAAFIGKVVAMTRDRSGAEEDQRDRSVDEENQRGGVTFKLTVTKVFKTDRPSLRVGSEISFDEGDECDRSPLGSEGASYLLFARHGEGPSANTWSIVDRSICDPQFSRTVQLPPGSKGSLDSQSKRELDQIMRWLANPPKASPPKPSSPKASPPKVSPGPAVAGAAELIRDLRNQMNSMISSTRSQLSTMVQRFKTEIEQLVRTLRRPAPPLSGEEPPPPDEEVPRDK